ncbi:MAG: PIN domain nuclease [Candidatus Sumerlaeota bacterium]|nr:PIN domain nuclease [Candidatus Sumerlaeota bacterium]
MILVDTSVMIEFLRGSRNAAAARFLQALDDGLPFGITSHVYQEVLQGAATRREFGLLKDYLDTQTFYELKHGRESHARAARLYFDCRRRGYTLTSTIDCLIAEVAIEHDLLLLHNDRDYNFLEKVAPKLRFY